MLALSTITRTYVAASALCVLVVAQRSDSISHAAASVVEECVRCWCRLQRNMEHAITRQHASQCSPVCYRDCGRSGGGTVAAAVSVRRPGSGRLVLRRLHRLPDFSMLILVFLPCVPQRSWPLGWWRCGCSGRAGTTAGRRISGPAASACTSCSSAPTPSRIPPASKPRCG